MKTKNSVQYLLLLALFYNALLAFLNAHVMTIKLSYVIIIELATLSAGLFHVSRTINFNSKTKLALGFLVFFSMLYFANCLFAVLAGNSISLKPARDIAIIFVFLLLGLSSAGNEQSLHRTVTISAILVSSFLLIELLRTDIYVKIFNVSSYYINTRDVSDRIADSGRGESGLYFSAMSYEGRFTFGFRTAQRLASLFLEQTTHANFAIVLAIYLSAFWSDLNAKSRAIILSTITLVILGTDSRQAFAICLMLLAGYHFFPKTSRFTLSLYIPLTLLSMFIFFHGEAEGDNFSGRLAYSIDKLLSADIQTIFGMRLAERVIDSGYTYLLYSQSLIGLVGFWLFLSKILPYGSANAKRLAHGTSIFYTVNLAVSGSTIFSIKTSALLWFIVGFYCSREIIASRRLAPDRSYAIDKEIIPVCSFDKHSSPLLS